MKAIHNYLDGSHYELWVVQHQSYYRIESNSQLIPIPILLLPSCTTSKLLQNWKQFTTLLWQFPICQWLYNIKVITELKAIHNDNAKVNITEIVVQHQSYYRIESNSQRWRFRIPGHFSCTTSKLLQNWKQFTTPERYQFAWMELYNIKVITELKAIHNNAVKAVTNITVVQHQSYYRIESNSQQRHEGTHRSRCCTTSKLLQNWKQFTTPADARYAGIQLYNIKVITELKAIHNYTWLISAHWHVVQHQSYYRIESNSQLETRRKGKSLSCTTSKLLQNWKQFTTPRTMSQ